MTDVEFNFFKNIVYREAINRKIIPQMENMIKERIRTESTSTYSNFMETVNLLCRIDSMDQNMKDNFLVRLELNSFLSQ